MFPHATVGRAFYALNVEEQKNSIVDVDASSFSICGNVII